MRILADEQGWRQALPGIRVPRSRTLGSPFGWRSGAWRDAAEPPGGKVIPRRERGIGTFGWTRVETLGRFGASNEAKTEPPREGFCPRNGAEMGFDGTN
jgi:hypothetical protein